MKLRNFSEAAGRVAALGSLLSACSAGPLPVSQSPRDPASPLAPEGEAPRLAYAAAPNHETAAAPSEHEHAPSEHQHAPVEHEHAAARGPVAAPPASGGAPAPASESATYACPMHPEVTSKSPGTCPKCGMKLVPKK